MPCLPSTLIHYDNTNPLSSMLTFSLDSLSFHTINMAQMKYILCLTIHSVAFNPKDCEHKQRYSRAINTAKDHNHMVFTPKSAVPRPWRECLECTQCKRSLVKALGWVYLHTAQSYLRDGQTLVLAGCFAGEAQDDARVITGGCIMPQSTQIYQ